MTATWIVPTLDEIEDANPRLLRCAERDAVEQFALQRREEAFAQRIVVAIADRAHRRTDASFSTATAEAHCGVLTALIGMMNDVVWLSLRDRHVQRRQHELGPQMRRHRPADDPATPDIQDHGQKQRARRG